MNQYIVETNEYITHIDLKNIRTLYLPIIGTKAVALYQSLADEALDTFKVDYRYITALMNSLQFNKEELLSARKTLEAVGLLKTYSNETRATFLFAILRPLNVQKLFNNKLLLNKLINSIGEVEVERLMFESKTQTIDKSGFVEISAKYHELFDVTTTQTIQRTTEITLPSFSNKEQAIKATTAEMFTKFLTNNVAGPSLAKTFDTLRDLGFSNESLNYIQDYSYKINKKVVAKYVETIAYDLHKTNITSSADIARELMNASMSKKQEIKKIEAPTETIAEGSELSLDEIFSDLFS
ncbi:DnaD domain protein [Mycoplasma marinum]|uniref:Replicative helicase loading/DNA remodeling protein DnaB N-terminal winged helix domain-containing protein n=1 Tax=Mycoplasma marinum TaxID=1937190 RepID=A0A4R0XU89_9MOLU|nr:DnaD domain protein [Mycoplasma marinum]TCG11239.1 hypothetical protein C4B24_02665 [Mycoplasma marinum]